MKTLFTLGLPGSFDFWNPQVASLGQAEGAPTGSLTEAQHAAILSKLKDAVGKISEVDAWIHSVGDGQAAIMGDSYGTFRGYIDFLAGLAEDVYPDYQRLNTTNIEEWWIPWEDGWKIDRFLTTTAQAYQLFQEKVKGILPMTPAVNAVPITPSPGTTRPGTPGAAPRSATSGVLPESKFLGIPSKTLLIGGGAVVGLGILLYALA